MENINLCEYLKDMPRGTRLYSLIHGKASLSNIVEDAKDFPIEIKNDYNSFSHYTKEGKYFLCSGGECILFPSKEMRDWSKFFKHGDVVKYNNLTALFDSWVDTTYTVFYAKYIKTTTTIYTNIRCCAKNYSKVSKDERIDFIKEIENHYVGKLNLETLEIEHKESDSNNHYALKPFDKVLVRDNNTKNWELNLFSHYCSKEFSPYQCLKGSWMQCIPYNENTAHLLDTNKDYKQTIDYGKDYSE